MKTITFYSYKGGVGRSLALSNIAMRLSELNKKVCIIDFDLDAPGLQFKFKQQYKQAELKKGLVDYIYDYTSTGIIPDNILDYCCKLSHTNIRTQDIYMIPAGNIFEDDYWKKLAMISWSDLFYSSDSKGIQFFLDLKSKIEKEINPDFLLIDSRTGITDISGITLRLFADEAVILAANNQENLFGSKLIIRNLLNQEGSIFGIIPKIHFVLTRLPFTDSPKDNYVKFQIIQEIEDELKRDLNLTDFEVNIIHSDRRLEEKEIPLIGYSYENKTVSISNDYLNLFELITAGSLTADELYKLELTKKAEIEFIKSTKEEQILKKIEFINNAIELDPNNYIYIFTRGTYHAEAGAFEKAMSDNLFSLKLSPENKFFQAGVYFNAAFYNFKLHNYKEALEFINSSIEISNDTRLADSYLLKYNILIRSNDIENGSQLLNYVIEDLGISSPKLLNARADLFRSVNKMKEAYADIYSAIEYDPDDAVFFATLAEINETDGKIDEFYLNFTTALTKGLKVQQLSYTKNIYLKYINDKRFVTLLNKYNISVEELKVLAYE